MLFTAKDAYNISICFMQYMRKTHQKMSKCPQFLEYPVQVVLFLCLSRKFHMKSSAETNTIGIVRKLCFFFLSVVGLCF